MGCTRFVQPLWILAPTVRSTIAYSFKRRRDVDAYATEIESDKLHGLAIDPRKAKTKFSTVAEKWLAAGTIKRASSVARDKSIIDTHLEPTFGDSPIGAITRADVQTVVDTWTATLSPSTVSRQFATLRSIFTYAEASEILMRSPCRSIRLPRMKLVHRPYLSPEQLSKLADRLGTVDGAFMWCGAVLGLRWAEVAGITVSRLDVLNRSLVIDRQLAALR